MKPVDVPKVAFEPRHWRFTWSIHVGFGCQEWETVMKMLPFVHQNAPSEAIEESIDQVRSACDIPIKPTSYPSVYVKLQEAPYINIPSRRTAHGDEWTMQVYRKKALSPVWNFRGCIWWRSIDLRVYKHFWSTKATKFSRKTHHENLRIPKFFTTPSPRHEFLGNLSHLIHAIGQASLPIK